MTLQRCSAFANQAEQSSAILPAKALVVCINTGECQDQCFEIDLAFKRFKEGLTIPIPCI
jgi:hypothetical protein